MDIEIAFLAAVSFERKRAWKKTARSYEEVLHLIFTTKAREHVNKEKLRLLLFECHFHCAVAYQNLQIYQKALQHFRRALHVVSWRKDDCQAGCITGRVLHLHVPTLARMACCHIHAGHLKKALNDMDKAIVLDFNNPDLFCIRALCNYLLGRQDQALQDVSFSIKLNSLQVCGWLLRGLFKQVKKEGTEIKSLKKEDDLEKVGHDLNAKACEVNSDAILFTSIKNLKTNFQAVFNRFLPSIQVFHLLSVRDVINIPDVDAGPLLLGRLKTNSRSKQEDSQLKDKIRVDTRAKISMFPSSSRPSFLCGVAKLHRMSSVNNDKHRARFFEWSPTKSSISHRNDDVTKMVSLRQPVSSGRCELRGSQLTLRDVLNSKRVCACPSERFIGIQDRCMELDWGVGRPHLGERMYARNWIQDRIPTKIPDHTTWPKIPK